MIRCQVIDGSREVDRRTLPAVPHAGDGMEVKKAMRHVSRVLWADPARGRDHDVTLMLYPLGVLPASGPPPWHGEGWE